MIDFKVYDVSQLSKQELNNIFCLIFLLEKRYDIETLSIDRVLNKSIFMEKLFKNVHQKLVQDSFLLVNNPKQPLHARNSFKNKIF